MKTLESTSSKGVIKRKSGFGMGFFKTHSPILTKNKKSLISRQIQKKSSPKINSIISKGSIISTSVFNSSPIKLISKTKKAPIVTFSSPAKLSSEIKNKTKSLSSSSDFLIPICNSGIKKKNGISHWNKREAIKTLIITSKQNNLSEEKTDKHIANIEIKTKELFNLKSDILRNKSKAKSKTKVKTKLSFENMKYDEHHQHHHHHISNSRRLFRIQQQQATPLSSDDSTRRESMPLMSKTNLSSPFNCIPSPFQMTPSPLNITRHRFSSSINNNNFESNANTLTPSESNDTPFTESELKDNNKNILFYNKNDTQLDDKHKRNSYYPNIFKRYQDFDLQSPTPAMPKKLFSLHSSKSFNNAKTLFDADSDSSISSPYNHLKNTFKNSYPETSSFNCTTSTIISSTPKITDVFSSPTPTPVATKVSDNEITNFVSSYQSTEDLLESPSHSLFSYSSQIQPSSSPIPSSPLANFNNENIINSNTDFVNSSPLGLSDFKINKRSDFTLDFIKDQIESNLLSPTPSASHFLRRSKSMIEGCNNYFRASKSKNEINNKNSYILLSPTPVAPRRRKTLFSTSSIDSIASTSDIKENEDEKNHDTNIKKDDSTLDSPSSSSSSSECNSFSKCFPKRICRTYSECSLQYLKNWKDASSFGHGEDSILPFNSGKDSLRRISATTLSKLLQGKYKGLYDEFHIIDCRFPYEYEGGHIHNAKNINDPAKLYNLFFNKEDYSKKVIIIFHCEFSSERAPWMAQFFRKADREKNLFFYPRLHYPEVYVLKGGYKEFYNNYKEFCSPQKYVEMADSKYIEQCKHHRKMFKKAKSTSELYYSSKYQHQEEESSYTSNTITPTINYATNENIN
ncbi:hypothetical protein BCR36DRAFT_344014 [Piromyces finnis]|uniref:M-phase inducer phosphatase n=1 Tax=Piromyces finnis TaxID=1754191 RepID=A0A1Y1VLF5_9FUNG|nr:hypothetical protein BCR36DRAFT_344014 [Piromyces finnis]|eukprot:ORX58589.1 hypothetical protein BCR36DRAFT_344014 [Piromyces finnis]